MKSDVRTGKGLQIVMDYAGEPTMTKNRPREIEISLRHGEELHDQQLPMELVLPEGWSVEHSEKGILGKRFILRAGKLETTNDLIVKVKTPNGMVEERFVMLENECVDFSESRTLVPRCQFCGGMRQVCGCAGKSI